MNLPLIEITDGDASTLKHNRKLTVCLTAICLGNSLIFMLEDQIKGQDASLGEERNSDITLRQSTLNKHFLYYFF